MNVMYICKCTCKILKQLKYHIFQYIKYNLLYDQRDLLNIWAREDLESQYNVIEKRIDS